LLKLIPQRAKELMAQDDDISEIPPVPGLPVSFEGDDESMDSVDAEAGDPVEDTGEVNGFTPHGAA
jgi:hypothetical protein